MELISLLRPRPGSAARGCYPRLSSRSMFFISDSRGSLRATNALSSLAALLRSHSSHLPVTTRGTLPPCSILEPETISSASAGSIGHVQRVKPPLSFSPFVGIQPDSPRLFRYSAVKRVSANGRSKLYRSPLDAGTRRILNHTVNSRAA